MITRRRLLQLAGAGLLSAAAVAGYPFLEVLGPPRINRYAFTPRGWTPGLKLRAAVIADIHACDPWMGVSRIEGIVAQTNELKADIILLLGDYTTGMSLVLEQVPSTEWGPALGVHAVLGNHDYWEDQRFQRDQSATPFAMTALTDAGIPTYRNQAIRLEKVGRPFWLACLDDQMALLPGKRYGRKRMLGIEIGRAHV